jgi:hypothetical protein
MKNTLFWVGLFRVRKQKFMPTDNNSELFLSTTMDREELMDEALKKKIEALDYRLKCLIAEKEGIKPEQVTVSYIREQREKRLYKTIRYNIGSEYGGYDLTGLKVFTGDELDDFEKHADEFFNSIAAESPAA